MKSVSVKTAVGNLNVFVADSWLSRLIGLMGRRGLTADTGLWLMPCGSIHTMWMRFSIDVIYLDSAHNILKISENLKPFRFDLAPRGTKSVIEVAAFNARNLGFQAGERIRVKQ